MNPTRTHRIPANAVVLLTRMRRTGRALRAESGRAPAFDEVAAALGQSGARKAMTIRALRSLQGRPPVVTDLRVAEPILLMEVTDEPQGRDGRAR